MMMIVLKADVMNLCFSKPSRRPGQFLLNSFTEFGEPLRAGPHSPRNPHVGLVEQGQKRTKLPKPASAFAPPTAHTNLDPTANQETSSISRQQCAPLEAWQVHEMSTNAQPSTVYQSRCVRLIHRDWAKRGFSENPPDDASNVRVRSTCLIYLDQSIWLPRVGRIVKCGRHLLQEVLQLYKSLRALRQMNLTVTGALIESSGSHLKHQICHLKWLNAFLSESIGHRYIYILKHERKHTSLHWHKCMFECKLNSHPCKGKRDRNWRSTPLNLCSNDKLPHSPHTY